MCIHIIKPRVNVAHFSQWTKCSVFILVWNDCLFSLYIWLYVFQSDCSSSLMHMCTPVIACCLLSYEAFAANCAPDRLVRSFRVCIHLLIHLTTIHCLALALSQRRRRWSQSTFTGTVLVLCSIAVGRTNCQDKETAEMTHLAISGSINTPMLQQSESQQMGNGFVSTQGSDPVKFCSRVKPFHDPYFGHASST